MNAQSTLPRPRDVRAIQATAALADHMLDIKGVTLATSLSKPTIYRMISRGEFPRSILLGRQRVGWSRRAIEDWLASRCSA